MSLIPNFHIVFATDEQKKIIKQALKDAGHDLIAAEKTAVASLWAEAKAKFPDLVADIQKGIKDVQDETISGGEKAVKVALDVMAAAPDVLKALPDAESFFVHAVTETYAELQKALVSAAAGLIGKL